MAPHGTHAVTAAPVTAPADGPAAQAALQPFTEPGLPVPVPDPPAFTRRLDPGWFSVDLGASVRGSTVWRQGALIVLSDGAGLMLDRDDCRYVHTGVTGDFSFTAELGAIATTDADALTGLLVRNGRETDAPGLFFGLRGDGRPELYRRKRGSAAEPVERAASSSFLPCRLRIVRHGRRFLADLSGDGTTWQPFAECPMDLAPTVRVGLAVASHQPGTMATAEFRELTLLVP